MERQEGNKSSRRERSLKFDQKSKGHKLQPQLEFRAKMYEQEEEEEGEKKEEEEGRRKRRRNKCLEGKKNQMSLQRVYLE